WDRPWVRLAFRIVLALFVVDLVMASALAWRALPETVLQHFDLYISISRKLLIVSLAASLAALAWSWHQARGTSRHRLAWVFICIGAVYCGVLMYAVNQDFGNVLSELSINLVQSILTCLGFLGIGYAMLRHRLFDFGFALSRALVVTIISTLLLMVF